MWYNIGMKHIFKLVPLSTNYEIPEVILNRMYATSGMNVGEVLAVLEYERRQASIGESVKHHYVVSSH